MSDRPRARANRRVGLADLGAVALLLATALIGFAPSFAGLGFARAAAGGALLGLGIAWLGASRAWPLLTVAAATIVAYVVAGGPLAVPESAIAGVVPTLETLRQLLLGAVTAWKGLLTVSPPVDAFPELTVVPFLAALLAAVLSGSLALRARRPAWALVPSGVLLVGVILLGTAQTVWPVVQGVGFALVALVWVAWRRAGARGDARDSVRQAAGTENTAQVSRALRTRRLRNAAALLGGAALVTALAAPVLTPDTHRHVLRDVVVPPLDLREYPSPLVGFRKYVNELEEEVLLRVGGLPEGARIRLATMDAYTGTVIDVAGGSAGSATGSGGFGPAGASIPAPARAVDGSEATLEVEIGAYRGVWVPTAGRAEVIRFEGDRASALEDGLYYNTETGAAITTAVLQSGDSFTLETVVPTNPTHDDLAGRSFARVQLPAPERVPTSVGSIADTFVGDATAPIEQVENLTAALSAGGVFSNGLDGQASSRAGHGADRIDTLLSGARMVGDDEQFAVAMALMARQLGIPARVVMGFYPDPETAAETAVVDIKGADVHAWVEVAFDGAGWVSFDPTPTEDQEPLDKDPRSSSEPEPQVLQDPPAPEEPAEPPLQPIPEAAEAETRDDEGIPWGQYARVLGVVTVSIVLLLSPFVLIAALKVRRRRGRLAAEAATDRVSGGWREVVDCAVDLGSRVEPSATRRETAHELAERYPSAGTVAVAERADAAVFGAGDPTDEEVAAFWAEVDALVSGMSQSVGRWHRLRARYSVRSLLRGRLPAVPGRGGPR